MSIIQRIELHCQTLTESEEISFIKRMKSLIDSKLCKIDPERPDNDDDERNILDRYHLFVKKNYYKYYMSKTLCDILLTAGNAYIYGGLLRDNILHDYMAEKFYDKEIGDTFEVYNDPKIDKDTSLRTLVPVDIDVLFHSHQNYEEFLSKAKLLGYNICYDSTIDDYTTPPQKEGETCRRHKLEISSNVGIQDVKRENPRFIDMDFVLTFITIDVTIANVYVPSYDFLCNSLIISRHGFIFRDAHYFTSVKSFIEDKQSQLKHVMVIEEQIHNMEAVMTSDHFNTSPVPTKHRVLKMVKKGWKIKYLDVFSEKLITQRDNDEDCCIVCREKFKEVANVPGVHKLYDGLKFSCCSAVYHPLCLIELLKKSRHGIRIDTNFSRYQCVQCAEVSMKFFREKMDEFLIILQQSWEEVSSL